jgi:DNA modification methylase
MNTDRAFIGIEKEERYFNMGVERLIRHKKELSERLF